MRVYRGTTNRQVGGGVWSTIKRGVRPLIESLFNFLKPHASKAGKEIAKSAFSAGTSLASDAIRGTISRAKMNQAMQNVRNEAANQVTTLKRKLVEQQGSGAARKKRKVSKRSKSKKQKPTKKSPSKKQKSKKQKSKKAPLRKVANKRIKKRVYKHTKKSNSFKDIFSQR